MDHLGVVGHAESQAYCMLSAANLTTPGNSCCTWHIAFWESSTSVPFSTLNGNIYAHEVDKHGKWRVYRFKVTGNTYTITDIQCCNRHLHFESSFRPISRRDACPVSTAPATPAAPTVDNATQTSLRISWVAPDDGGEAITSYDLRYREQGTGLRGPTFLMKRALRIR